MSKKMQMIYERVFGLGDLGEKFPPNYFSLAS